MSNPLPNNEGFADEARVWLKEERILDRATFTGMLLGKDKLAVLRDADMFVLPSYTENFGISVVEAMACGVPVVISDKVNIWREVAGSKAGRVAPCDADRFADIILELLDNPEMARQMGENGKALVQERYQWSKVAVQWRMRIVLLSQVNLNEEKQNDDATIGSYTLLWNDNEQ